MSIPFTVFLTFILMRLRGMTLNIMTLAGITVAVGMMVDSSIVILENTVRHRRLGLDAASSASIGAHEVGPAVLASTSTSLSVFLPVLWVSGLAGAILTEVSWVLIFALASSALTAIFIVPWLASRLLDGERRPGGLAKFGEAFETWFSAAANGYSRFLTTILDHKVFVLVLAILLIGASLLLIGALGGEMFAAPDMNEFEMTVRLPSGYSLEQGEVKMRQVAELVRQEVPEMEADLWYAGLADSATIVDSGNPSAGYGRIRLVRTRSRNRSVFEIINQLNRTLASEIPDAEFSIRNGGLAKLMNYATDGAGSEWKCRVPTGRGFLRPRNRFRRFLNPISLSVIPISASGWTGKCFRCLWTGSPPGGWPWIRSRQDGICESSSAANRRAA